MITNRFILHRPLPRFLAISITLHLCLLAEFKHSFIASNRHLGQLVLDIQLQGDTGLPAPIPSSQTATHSPPATKTSGAHAVTAAVETIANPFPSVSAADAGSEPHEPISTAKTEAGLRNQLLGELQTRLSHYLTYPPLARRRGWEGTVLLGLSVESDGHLDKIHVARSSGYAVLDRSALNSLSRLGYLVEASAWLDGRGMDMQLPVIYRLIEN
ncbi:MAG: energy transducer TonB [Gammaproteobacteria bacterium]|nr:energy transducer TonB [Gammaproteobacteria bacterium]